MKKVIWIPLLILTIIVVVALIFFILDFIFLDLSIYNNRDVLVPETDQEQVVANNHQPYQHLLVTIKSPPAELLIIDSGGKRCGYDSKTGQTLNEIPGAHYDRGNLIEDLETGEYPTTGEKYLVIPEMDANKYKLMITGIDSGAYNVSVLGDNQSMVGSFKEFKNVPITPGEVHIYEIQFQQLLQKFEAEKMTRSNYTIEAYRYASHGKLARITNGTKGSLSFTYFGGSGVKDLNVLYYDQKGVTANYKLYINNVLIDSWAASNESYLEADRLNPMHHSISDIQINAGDQIRIEGQVPGSSGAVVDSVEISNPLTATRR